MDIDGTWVSNCLDVTTSVTTSVMCLLFDYPSTDNSTISQVYV